MEAIKGILMEIDETTLKVIIVILAIIMVISVIKKVISLFITIAIVVIISVVAVPMVQDIQSQYNIRVEDSVLMVTVDSKDYSLDLPNCTGIELNETEDKDTYSMVLKMEDGDKVIEIPKFMGKGVEKIAEANDIPFEQ